MRIRAPELVGRGGWLNTGGKSYALADLRGKIVLLDFWTFCCINCLHVLDELRPLEEKYADVLVIVGVHSPKFVHEADPDAVAAAVERYERPPPGARRPRPDDLAAVRRARLADAGRRRPRGLRRRPACPARATPTRWRAARELVAEHEAKGTLHRGDGPYVAPPPPEPSTLRFPAKAVALPDGTLLVADSGHHSLVELAADGETVLRRIGTGARGLVDGGPTPRGSASRNGLLPAAGRGRRAGRLRRRRRRHRQPRPARRTPRRRRGHARSPAPAQQWMQATASRRRRRRTCRCPRRGTSPGRRRSRGRRRDGRHPPAVDVRPGRARPERSSPAPPTRACSTARRPRPGSRSRQRRCAADGDRLWFADSETSSLRSSGERRRRDRRRRRAVRLRPRRRAGRRRAAAAPARASPCCPTARCRRARHVQRRGAPLRPGDAHGQRRWPPGCASRRGAVLDVDGDLLVVESAAHRLTRIGLPDEAAGRRGRAQRTRRPATEVAPLEPFELDVVFEPPAGQKLDERYGPSTRLVVSATPPELLVEGAGSGEELARRAGARRRRRRRRPARRGVRGVVRRRRRGRVPRLPRAPAGLGRPGPPRRPATAP